MTLLSRRYQNIGTNRVTLAFTLLLSLQCSFTQCGASLTGNCGASLFLYPKNDVQCMGFNFLNASNPNVSTSCMQACCDDPKCMAWQWKHPNNLSQNAGGGCFGADHYPGHCFGPGSEGKFPEGWFGGSLGKFSCVEDRCTLLNETASAYNFSDPACNGTCAPYSPVHKHTVTKGIDSVGAILLICVFSVAVIYIVIGVKLNKNKGLSGKELMPHWSFWSEVPGLIRDGTQFTAFRLRGCWQKICGGSGYNEL